MSSPRPWVSPEPYRRNVVVTARKVLTPSGGRRILLRQVAYIQRGAADLGARNGVFFDKTQDPADARQFVERCQNERAHYRLVVNPEDGTELGDLKEYARILMKGVDDDLGGGLDWIAGAHFNTGRPHLHIILRGRRATDQSLKISGAYLSSGLRDRARDVATEILGPRAKRAANRTIQADRFTPLDRLILQTARGDQLDLKRIPVPFLHDILRRLAHLENRGWATPVSPALWRLLPDLRQTLLQLGQMRARELAAAHILEHSGWRNQRSRLEAVSPGPGEKLTGSFVGVHRTGRYPGGAHAVVLDLTDGRLVGILMRDARSVLCLDRIQEGAVIEVFGTLRGERPADRVIAEVAAERGGVWSAADHAAARPKDWPKFITFHEKRARAMSVAGACTALGDGRFAVPADYLLRAGQADIAQWGEAELKLRVMDHRNLDDQVGTMGLTWLDRLLANGRPPAFSGLFGDAVKSALQERAKRLRMMGLGSGDPLALGKTDIHHLTALEVKSVIEALRRDGKAVFLITSGEDAVGAYAGRIHIAGAPYGVLEGKSAINLVPWAPGLEACRGQTLTAAVRDGTTCFRTGCALGRELGLG